MKKQVSLTLGARIVLLCLITTPLSVYSLYSLWERDAHADIQLIGQPERMLFLGDVFLGRGVETRMEEFGEDYPFSHVSSFLRGHDEVFANFEAPIPEVHTKTKDFTFNFSVDRAYADVLGAHGITGVSLANNHTLDKGTDAYEHTKEVLRSAGIAASGHPKRVGGSDVQYYDLDNVRIAVVPLNLTFGGAPAKEAALLISKLEDEAEHVIVYVHWGAEYKLHSNKTQQSVAHTLIDAGADAIIGHHPHVVQEVERYKNGIIFYSLGNFIFDQYFSEHVETGLAISLSQEDGVYSYELYPVSSTDTRSAPKLLSGDARAAFLQSLAERSGSDMREATLAGIITQRP